MPVFAWTRAPTSAGRMGAAAFPFPAPATLVTLWQRRVLLVCGHGLPAPVRKRGTGAGGDAIYSQLLKNFISKPGRSLGTLAVGPLLRPGPANKPFVTTTGLVFRGVQCPILRYMFFSRDIVQNSTGRATSFTAAGPRPGALAAGCVGLSLAQVLLLGGDGGGRDPSPGVSRLGKLPGELLVQSVLFTVGQFANRMKWYSFFLVTPSTLPSGCDVLVGRTAMVLGRVLD